MKKLLLILLLFVSFTSVAQESKSFEETLTPYVEKILQGLEKGVEFAQEEIPIVLKQYVMYEAVMSWFLVLVGVFLMFGLPTISRKNATVKDVTKEMEGDLPAGESYRKVKNNKYLRTGRHTTTPDEFFHDVFPYFSIIVGVIIFFSAIHKAVLTTFFPKLFLVKEFLNHI